VVPAFNAAIRDALAKLKDLPATTEELFALLERSGIRFDNLRDPWGNPLHANVSNKGDRRTIEILCERPTPIPSRSSGSRWPSTLALTSARCREDRGRQKAARQFPVDEAQLRALLSTAGLDFGALRDPWASLFRHLPDRRAIRRPRPALHVTGLSRSAGQRKEVIPLSSPTA